MILESFRVMRPDGHVADPAFGADGFEALVRG